MQRSATFAVRARSSCLFVAVALAVSSRVPSAQAAHAIALHGEPRYPPGFHHFDYVNPHAPKGGRMRRAMSGTFDTLNPFVSFGTRAPVLASFETLLVPSDDEPNTAYGLLAREVVLGEHGTFVDFELHPSARFHDGTAVTAEDVAFSFELLVREGHPRYRMRYANVQRAEARSGGWVRFFVERGDLRATALSLGELPVLSRRDVEGRRSGFERTLLDPLLGSGPYRIRRVVAGRSLVLERVRDYWGAELGVRRGQHNFDEVSYEYFRDFRASREALFADRVDARPEAEAQAWARSYRPEEVEALARGFLIKESVPHQRMPSVQTFAFNLRRPPFDDWRVRRAIHLAFDFEWMNERLFFGQYERTRSLFPAFGLSATGLPAGEELDLLERFRGRLSPRVWSSPRLPETDGSGYPRENLKRALGLLEEAGYVARQTELVHRETGQRLELEILLRFKGFERISLPFVRNLRRLGIDARVRVIDSAHYEQRLRGFDYDLIAHFMLPSASPGRELFELYSSGVAGEPGTRNRAGIADPVVDELLRLVVAAESRESLASRVRALDRVLLAGDYFVPLWHARFDRVVYWDRFGHPESLPGGAFGFDAWWWDEGADRALSASRVAARRAEARGPWLLGGLSLVLGAALWATRARRSRPLRSEGA